MIPFSARPVLALLALIGFGLAACSELRPTLQLNSHLQSVGKEAAERDIADCLQKAEEEGHEARTPSAASGLTSGTSGIGTIMAGGIAGVGGIALGRLVKKR